MSRTRWNDYYKNGRKRTLKRHGRKHKNTTDARSGKEDKEDSGSQRKQQQQKQQKADKPERKKQKADQPRRSQEEAGKSGATDTQEGMQYGNHKPDTMERLLGEWMGKCDEEEWQATQEKEQMKNTDRKTPQTKKKEER